MNEVVVIDGVPMASSRKVAERFEKRHDNVLRDIEVIKEDLLKSKGINLSKIEERGLLNFEESSLRFFECNFIPSTYKNNQGKKQPEYLLTRDGFALLTMGFTGSDALKFKITYINRFNEMEQFILSRNLAKLEYPELTDMIRSVHDDPQGYHYSNEADMINLIVLGERAREFRSRRGLAKGESIRDYLTPWQVEMIQKLQKMDVGLVAIMPDFEQRKDMLRAYFDKLVDFKGALSAQETSAEGSPETPTI